MTNRSWLALMTTAAVVLSPGLIRAQEDTPASGVRIEQRIERLVQPVSETFDVVLIEDEKDGNAAATEYWLGVQVAVVPEIAKRQLGIDHGLAVEDVSPGSPADKAEMKKFDILLEADGKPLARVDNLVKSVEAAKGKQIVITIKRDGQSKKLEVVAEQKAKAEAAVDAARKKIEAQKPKLAAEIKQLEEAIEKLKASAGKEGFGMWFAKPAIVAPRFDVRTKEETIKAWKGDFPKDLSVQINKQGDQQTKIHIKRQDQEWDITEDKLGDLPEDIRVYIQQMLGHMKGPAALAGEQRVIRVMPGGKIEGELKLPPLPPKPAVAPKPPVPPAVSAAPAKPAIARTITARVERDSDATSDKLDAIMKKLDKLEKEIDELRDKK